MCVRYKYAFLQFKILRNRISDINYSCKSAANSVLFV